jgi:integrase
MTPATLARVHATLSAALNTAGRQSLLDGHPLAGVELPRVDRVEPAIWTLEQARRFLGAVRGDELEGLWRLALVTGMRRGELLGLRWDDVDTDRLDADRTYRRTLVTAVTALATTLVPHPVIAAALGVWITDTPRPPLRPVDYDPDEDDDPPPWRSRPTLWNTFGQ